MLIDRNDAAQICEDLRRQGNKIVFTNGCFDIIHAGHVRYLTAAKNFGDVLIVGLNSDESVRRLKGASRPINNQDDRAEVLLALRAVDHVIFFGEETAEILFHENQKRLLANEQPLEIPVVSDDYDDDLPKNPFLRAMYRFFLGHRHEDDED